MRGETSFGRRPKQRPNPGPKRGPGPRPDPEADAELYIKWKEGLRTPGKPDEYEAKMLLKSFGLTVPREILIMPDAGDDLPDLPFPVVLKVCSPEILHKTDRGGVKLNIGRDDFSRELSEMRKAFPGTPLLASEMVGYDGQEMIVGALRDPSFGASVMTGAGGILTELYRDTSFRLAPLGCENRFDDA